MSSLSGRINSLEEMMLLPAILDTEHWQAAVGSARSIIRDIDRLSWPVDLLGHTGWIRLITMLQNLAYQDPDNGGVVDVALWCERQWATLLQNDPVNMAALQSLGHAWLLKSQVILAKIDHAEGSSSSQESENGLRRSPFRPPPTNGDTGDNGDTTRANSSDYIEARALLRPSLDFFDRAVNAGDRQQIATAELLELAAEANMSFANVTHPRDNEAYYQKALVLLQRASQMEGHEMNEHLRSFLEENLELIE